MRSEYPDKFGNDSLIHLKLASKAGAEIFVTNNKQILEDKEELQKNFHIQIKTPREVLNQTMEMKK